VKEPYSSGISSQKIYTAKRPVKALFVSILELEMTERDLELIVPQSRAVRAGDVFELVTSMEEAGPGGKIDTVAYLGFAEMQNGGLILVGDSVIVDEKVIGEVIGFDETHAPNHLNIVIRTPDAKTGHQRGLKVEQEIKFVKS